MELEEISTILLKHVNGTAIIKTNSLEIVTDKGVIFAMEWDFEYNLWIVWRYHSALGTEWCPSYGIDTLVNLLKECI